MLSFIGGLAAPSAGSGRRASCSRSRTVTYCEPAVTWQAGEWSKKATDLETVMGPAQILEKLPHRFPFLLVDRVVDLKEGESIVGIKNVTFNEPHFTGHFPENPIMPGVLMIEALAQLSGLLIQGPPMVDDISEVKGFFFGGIDSVRFRKPIIPGDTIYMEAKITSAKKKFGIAKCQGKGFVDGKLAFEANITLTLVK